MKRLVLAGAGHAHALVLHDLARNPLCGVEVVVVSPQALAPYSGMVPGWLAGTYRFDEIVVDFPQLCRAAGARWVEDEIDRVDPEARSLGLRGGESIGFDVLSVNVGSTLRPPSMRHALALPLRPLSHLRVRYEHLLEAWQHRGDVDSIRISAVGGGAAGVESLLAILARLRAMRPDRTVHGRLLTRGGMVLPGLSGAARRAAHHALTSAGCAIALNAQWSEADDLPGEVALWATGAEAHDWQRDPSRRGALAVDADGFLRVDEFLRTVSHPHVFAAGDCASFGPRPLPKAGVFAVRMGPVLACNLRRALDPLSSETPDPYRPQDGYLALLATADRRAIATRGLLGAQGAWAWRLKDRIDRAFLARFARLPHSPMSTKADIGATRSPSIPARSTALPGDVR